MSASENRGRYSGALVAIVAGLIGGLLLVTWASRQARFADRNDAELSIRINGLDQRTSRDVLLPTVGWVLEIEMPEGLSDALRNTLSVTLRSERTGTIIQVETSSKSRADGHPRDSQVSGPLRRAPLRPGNAHRSRRPRP